MRLNLKWMGRTANRRQTDRQRIKRKIAPKRKKEKNITHKNISRQKKKRQALFIYVYKQGAYVVVAE